MLATRGCPYACTFCYQQVTFGQRWRGMSPGRMLAEATNADFRGATEKDLAGVIAEFGKYF